LQKLQKLVLVITRNTDTYLRSCWIYIAVDVTKNTRVDSFKKIFVIIMGRIIKANLRYGKSKLEINFYNLKSTMSLLSSNKLSRYSIFSHI